MKYSSILILLLYVASCSRPDPAHTKEALQIFDEFQARLLFRLNAAVEKEGIVAAISICKTVSPEIEKEISVHGWIIRRTSTRPRRPEHKPDAFENRTLAQWQSNLQSGKKPEAVAEIEAGELRVMRPIVIQTDICLRCHGTEDRLDSAALKEIIRLYPEDKATGYAVGDLRGAFSAVRKIE